MRRKISLYIADQLVDLDDQSFILLNYQMDDLSNPTIVKNSFSQQITLKGTPANNRIFGDSFRLDRRVGNQGGQSGADFNASQKTPFVIYNELSEILESGYVKLDSIDRRGADIQYKVTLYGGLGSFLFSLAYDENGNKRTLADLVYLNASSPDTELNFVINAASVREAWARIRGENNVLKWDVINFAPAYNGIPDGNFSPDKALVDPNDVGLPDSITQEGVQYTTRGGYCLVNLAEAQDEWAVKDLRSYLQRPVFSMKAFLEAICDPANNGGYEVDASAVLDNLTMGNFANLWMTLPLLPSIGSVHQESGDLSLTMSSSASSGNFIGRYDVGGSVPSGTKINATLHCRVRFNTPAGADSYSTLQWIATYNHGNITTSKFNAIFIQAVAYGSDNTIVGGSKIKVAGYGPRGNVSDIAAMCGYVPAWAADYEPFSFSGYNRVTNGVFEIPVDLAFSIEAQDVAYYKILVSVYPGIKQDTERAGGTITAINYSGNGSTSTPEMFIDYERGFTPLSAYIVQGQEQEQDIITYTTSNALRSGATITKAMLLSSSHTPAEYLLSFCKAFGLYFTYDVATEKVTILRRNDLYRDETIDLTRRVDLSKGISIQPLVFQAKWYDFILEGVGGAFYDEYLNVEGMPFGIQRVNTGYDFNADVVNLMDSVVFKNACTILARSKYFNYIFNSADFQPSPFLDKGNTFTLWSATGETIETDISCPPTSSSVHYYNTNPSYRGYDINGAGKLELRDAENKPIDGADILVFLDGWQTYDYFKVTDDVPAMDVVNDGVPCWLLGAGSSGLNAPNIPLFRRYVFGDPGEITDSLDFGVPRQMDIPGVRISEGCSVYERAWKKYISDRYDVNTKVMTCHVNFAGMPVNQELLRKFYWYENSMWVLNKIKNYSLTTYDSVECEFVQVQDTTNYLNGQTF